MSALLPPIAELLRDPLDVKLARSILGTDDPAVIARRVEAYCREHLGRRPLACELFTQSVGAVFVLAMEDGERVVLKAHGHGPPLGSLEALLAVYQVQEALAAAGFPCARVLQPPVPWPGGSVAAMSYLDGSGSDDPHDPAVRRALARCCARAIQLLQPFHDRPHLPVSTMPDRLWPAPHNVLFDFTTAGGEWIDERARVARAVLDASPPPLILAHTDISCANVRVREGQVAAVYDMDSVGLVDEAARISGIAVHFTYQGGPEWSWPSREEACAFLADYQEVRGRPFTADERARLDAGAIYAMAYTARCELSAPSEPEAPTSMRALLRRAPARGYFEP